MRICTGSKPLATRAACDWSRCLTKSSSENSGLGAVFVCGCGMSKPPHGITKHGFCCTVAHRMDCFDTKVASLLGLDEKEKIAGFIYIGTAMEPPKERARPEINDVLTYWPSHEPSPTELMAEIVFLVELAWPVVISRVAIFSLVVVDTIMYLRHASDELAFLGIGLVPSSICILFIVGLLMGTMVKDPIILAQVVMRSAVLAGGVLYLLQLCLDF